jgi:hypothetical protein
VNSFNETDIGEAARSLVLNILSRELHTCIPGAVTKVYTKGTSRIVDAKPLIRVTQIDGAQADLDIIQGVLLLTIGTTISSVIMPITAGDLVLLIFSEKALENWGLSTQSANGIYGRQFDMSDAFAIPMNFGSTSTTENSNNADMLIKHNGQSITIKNNGDINVGGTGLLKLVTSAFKDIFNNHVHLPGTYSNSGGPVAGASGAPTTTLGDSHLTSKVQAQ